MLRNAKGMEGYAVDATDGVIGHVKDFYIDDEAWVIRYLVVDTGGWLSSRKVLVSPIAVGTPDWERSLMPVSLTRDQVKKSPDIDTDKPVSRQHEMSYAAYYGYSLYWAGAGYWGGGMYPNLLLPGYGGLGGGNAIPGKTQPESAQDQPAEHTHEDPHLRSCNAVIGYHIHASDGAIGHVSGMLIDDQTWAVRYLIVDTGNWWFGHHVLIAPQWLKEVSWSDETVAVSMTRQAIKDAPDYEPSMTLSRDAEGRLYEHYGYADYWSGYPVRENEISRI